MNFVQINDTRILILFANAFVAVLVRVTSTKYVQTCLVHSWTFLESVENSWKSCGSPAGNFSRDVCRPDQKLIALIDKERSFCMEIGGNIKNVMVSMALIGQLHPYFGGYSLLGDV